MSAVRPGRLLVGGLAGTLAIMACAHNSPQVVSVAPLMCAFPAPSPPYHAAGPAVDVPGMVRGRLEPATPARFPLRSRIWIDDDSGRLAVVDGVHFVIDSVLAGRHLLRTFVEGYHPRRDVITVPIPRDSILVISVVAKPDSMCGRYFVLREPARKQWWQFWR